MFQAKREIAVMVIFVTFRLPHISSVDTAWDFLEILFEELRCECFYQRDVDENSSSASNVPPSAGVGNGPVPVVQAVKYGVGSSLVEGPGKKRKVSTTSSSSSASEDEEPGITTDAFFVFLTIYDHWPNWTQGGG